MLKKIINVIFGLVAIVFIIIGSIKCYDYYSNLNSIKNMQSISITDNELNNNINSLNNLDTNNNQDIFSDISNIEIPSFDELKEHNTTRNKNKVKKSIVGSIEIPKLNLNLNIINGTNSLNLMYGATTVLPNQKVGEGNYVLAGHNMLKRGVLFSNLLTRKDTPNIFKGDKIYIHQKDKTFIYEVESTEVVNRFNTSILKQTENPELTLFTCTRIPPSGKTDYRFVVHAKLVN